MPWLQLVIDIPQPHVEALSAVLDSLGAVAVTATAADDEMVLEPPPDATPLWSRTRVIGLFAITADAPALSAALRARFGSQITDIDAQVLADQPWERAWMEGFEPLRCGTRLWICPSWRAPPDPHGVVVTLDPGLAFGTGTHPTTALCLEWLDAYRGEAHEVIDYGCGSGILAVAACKLGARRAWAVDHDPQALRATRDNAARNSVAAQIEACYPADLPEHARGEVVLANILAGPLIELAPQLTARARPGGYVVLAGLLETQAAEVAAAYQAWLVLDPPATRESWVRLSGVRRGGSE